MKWDIDKALLALEPESCQGTALQRAVVDVKLLTTAPEAYRLRYGGGKIRPTAEELERGRVLLWCLSIGLSYAPKAMFYARTIRGAYLQAVRAVKESKLDSATPWGRQDFTPPKPRAKSRGSRAPRSRTGSPATPHG